MCRVHELWENLLDPERSALVEFCLEVRTVDKGYVEEAPQGHFFGLLLMIFVTAVWLSS
jgi:hypothetical protein